MPGFTAVHIQIIMRLPPIFRAALQLVNVLNGTLNWLGWGIVAVYLFFTVGFGCFWFNDPT